MSVLEKMMKYWGVISMGLLDAIFGNHQPPKINSILPTAAKNEIRAGRLPILNTDSLFLKRGEKIHYIDKAINLEIKTVKQYRHVGHSTPGLLKGKQVIIRTCHTRLFSDILF